MTVRSWHRKSKAGCSTCKLRRIKCDETRPICLRCKRGGRTCLGFPHGVSAQDRGPPQRQLKFVQSKYEALVLKRSPSVDAQAESGLLSFFLNVTLPSITNYMPCRVWQEANVKHQISNSSFKDIALAIATYHQSIERCGNSATTSSDDVQRLKAYSKALLATKSLVQGGDANLKSAIFGNIFLIILECMRGSGEALKIHLLNGLRVLRVYGHQLDRYTLSEFHQIYATVGISCMLQHADPEVFIEMEQLPGVELPGFSPLVDFERLRAATGHVIVQTYCCVAKVALNAFQNEEERNVKLQACYQELSRMEEELQSCSLVDRWASVSLRNLVQAKLQLCRIFLDTCLAGHQSAYDQHNASFRKIMDLMHEIIEQRALESSVQTDRPWSFSFGSGIMAILTFVLTQCRQPQIRRDALQLLDRCPQKEGLRSSADTRNIGQALMRFEEVDVDQNDQDFTIPEKNRAHFPRFEASSEINPSSIIYALCRPDTKSDFQLAVIPINELSS